MFLPLKQYRKGLWQGLQLGEKLSDMSCSYESRLPKVNGDYKVLEHVNLEMNATTKDIKDAVAVVTIIYFIQQCHSSRNQMALREWL